MLVCLLDAIFPCLAVLAPSCTSYKLTSQRTSPWRQAFFFGLQNMLFICLIVLEDSNQWELALQQYQI